MTTILRSDIVRPGRLIVSAVPLVFMFIRDSHSDQDWHGQLFLHWLSKKDRRWIENHFNVAAQATILSIMVNESDIRWIEPNVSFQHEVKQLLTLVHGEMRIGGTNYVTISPAFGLCIASNYAPEAWGEFCVNILTPETILPDMDEIVQNQANTKQAEITITLDDIELKTNASVGYAAFYHGCKHDGFFFKGRQALTVQRV